MKRFIKIIMIFLSFTAFLSFDMNSLKEVTDALPKPKASIEKFDIESMTLRDITFLFDIGITNPYPVKLKLDDIGFTVLIEKKQLFKTNTEKGFQIKPNGKEVSTFRVNLKYEDIINIVKDYVNREFLACRVDILIVIPLPKMSGLPKDIKFEYSLDKQIPAIKPSVEIADFKVQKPAKKEIEEALRKAGKQNLNQDKVQDMFNSIISGEKPEQVVDPASLDLPLTVNFNIELNNKTKSRLVFKSLDYSFLIDSQKFVDGKTVDIQTIDAKSILRVSNKFSSRVLGKTILSAFEKKKGKFSLKGSSFIKLPDSIKKEPLKLVFDENGDLDIK